MGSPNVSSTPPHDTGRPVASTCASRLENGDRLTRAEFERRYESRPDLKKAELIEGVVCMPSPTRSGSHARPHAPLVGWLFAYVASTPGVQLNDNPTIRLDLDNEPQPDVALLIDPAAGGQARVSDDDCIEGAPELVAEIAASSASYDLHDKLHAYRRNGVCEYLVWRTLDRGSTGSSWSTACIGYGSRMLPGSSTARCSPGCVWQWTPCSAGICRLWCKPSRSP